MVKHHQATKALSEGAASPWCLRVLVVNLIRRRALSAWPRCDALPWLSVREKLLWFACCLLSREDRVLTNAATGALFVLSEFFCGEVFFLRRSSASLPRFVHLSFVRKGAAGRPAQLYRLQSCGLVAQA